jgi:amino acid transporter
MSLLVMISALGALNGLIFTGSRVYSTLGSEHSIFAWLGRWHPRLGSPHWSLLVQAAISLLMIAVVGTEPGRNQFDALLGKLGLREIPWKDYQGGFATLVAGTAPVFWLFFLLTGLSLFKLREQDHGIERPFTVPFYPILPFVFCSTCLYMLYQSTVYAKWLTLFGAIPLLVGFPLYLFSTKRVPAAAETA